MRAQRLHPVCEFAGRPASPVTGLMYQHSVRANCVILNIASFCYAAGAGAAAAGVLTLLGHLELLEFLCRW